jgi:hypothetical protein
MWLFTLQLFKNSIDTQEKLRLNLHSLSVSELLEYGRRGLFAYITRSIHYLLEVQYVKFRQINPLTDIAPYCDLLIYYCIYVILLLTLTADHFSPHRISGTHAMAL